MYNGLAHKILILFAVMYSHSFNKHTQQSSVATDNGPTFGVFCVCEQMHKLT